MTAYQALLFWFDETLRKEGKSRIFINILVLIPFTLGISFACFWYHLNFHRLLELLESEEGMPLFANIGAIIYANLQEDEMLERLRSFVRYLMNENNRDPKLDSRLQKAVINLIKHKLKEEVKYPISKSE